MLYYIIYFHFSNTLLLQTTYQLDHLVHPFEWQFSFFISDTSPLLLLLLLSVSLSLFQISLHSLARTSQPHHQSPTQGRVSRCSWLSSSSSQQGQLMFKYFSLKLFFTSSILHLSAKINFLSFPQRLLATKYFGISIFLCSICRTLVCFSLIWLRLLRANFVVFLLTKFLNLVIFPSGPATGVWLHRFRNLVTEGKGRKRRPA